MSVRNLVEEFSALKDSRCRGTVEHRLIDVLVIAICAVIAGAESWEDFALYGRSKEDWLGTFLTLPNGIPVKSRPISTTLSVRNSVSGGGYALRG